MSSEFSELSKLLTGPGEWVVKGANLERWAALELIREALRLFPSEAVVSTAFGPGGLCVLDMALEVNPSVEAYYVDTGYAFAETTALAHRWVTERHLRLEVVRPRTDSTERFRSDPDTCCAERKVEPNERVLATKKLWIAALRRDESPSRAAIPILSELTLASGHSLLKLCPIATWSEADVWRYILDRGLPYNPLHDRGYRSIGCAPCTRPVRAGESERAGRWAGTEKQECGIHVPHRPKQADLEPRILTRRLHVLDRAG
ncbi:MAG: phosphoadenylyl-sulfate reductase [Deltaproteobacteria bacterium]|nr:phosphoadenylyl-sulfate reductase [Deltaproteobacteria bacterium]